MANFPGWRNTIPSVYGPTDHEFYYGKTHLTIYWYSGNIALKTGSWHEAAIAIVNRVLAFRKSDPIKPSNSIVTYGKIKINVDNLEMSLLHLPPQTPPDTISEEEKKKIKEQCDRIQIELEKNFLILKENFDKVKNLMVFI
jgi:hypothetical protein